MSISAFLSILQSYVAVWCRIWILQTHRPCGAFRRTKCQAEPMPALQTLLFASQRLEPRDYIVTLVETTGKALYWTQWVNSALTTYICIYATDDACTYCDDPSTPLGVCWLAGLLLLLQAFVGVGSSSKGGIHLGPV